MRETQFIHQKQEKWQEYEAIIKDKQANPNELSKAFIELTDDLSHAQTFYKNRSVRVYLNNLGQQIFVKLYKTKKTSTQRFKNYWLEELPQIMYESRKEFLFTFIIFAFAMFIGIFSTAMDTEFPRVVLGDGYIQMTLENIKKGDPMAVYKRDAAFGMFLGITMNNIWVSFVVFFIGIIFGVGTIAMLFREGIRLGAFFYFFVQKQLFWDAFYAVWLHGTLEMSAIVIAGVAGLVMGKGLAFPNSYSRLQSFQLSARRGIKIMMSLVPIFIMAGFIESFLTRYTHAPNFLRGLLILTSLSFILFYYVWYPRYKAKKGFLNDKSNTIQLPADKPFGLNLMEIKSNNQILNETIRGVGMQFKPLILVSLLGGGLYCLWIYLFATEDGTLRSLFNMPYGIMLSVSSPIYMVLSLTTIIYSMGQYFSNQDYLYIFVINTIIYTLVAIQTHHSFSKTFDNSKKFNVKDWLWDMIRYAPIVFLLMLSFTATNQTLVFLAIFLALPFSLLWISILQDEQKANIIKALGYTFRIITNNFMKTLGVFSLIMLLGILIYALGNSFILNFYLQIMHWNIKASSNVIDDLSIYTMIFISVSSLCFFFSMLIYGFTLYYYNIKESLEADGLITDISSIGKIKKIQGLEQE